MFVVVIISIDIVIVRNAINNNVTCFVNVIVSQSVSVFHSLSVYSILCTNLFIANISTAVQIRLERSFRYRHREVCLGDTKNSVISASLLNSCIKIHWYISAVLAP